MGRRGWMVLAGLVVGVGMAWAGSSWAKGKGTTLPPYVLQAETVAVVIDPQAGVSLTDPHANQTAQRDVETALMNWGRFRTVVSAQGADLVIVVRRGHGRLVDETVQDPRQNSRPGVFTPGQAGIGAASQRGTSPALSGADVGGPGTREPRAQTEIGMDVDEFTVYEGGGQERPLDGVPAWRYMAKDGLKPHGVPAVAEFRKAIAEAEKAAAAAQQGKKP